MSYSRSILITGGTAGLGYYCTIELARQFPNYQVIIASRSDSQDATGSINKLLGQNNVNYLRLDLSDLSQIRSFVQQWETNNYPPIQYLHLNAGLQFPGPVEYTVNGYEKTFAINHIGHALLFSLLVPHLAHTARIVVTSSGTHDPLQKTGLPDAKYTSAEELAHPTKSTAQNPGRQRYSTSKLANVLWVYALHRHLNESKDARLNSWTVVAFDPGLMPGTGLVREANPVVRFLWHVILPRVIPLLRVLLGTPNIKSPQVSGATLAWLASGKENSSSSGVYYEGREQICSSEESNDLSKQDDLWDWTVRNVASTKEEVARFSLTD
ncbi:short-chain dehydrogenase [Aspergillus costaricaensis CBS 115574]|uniref:Short-chain dehydrogenase n=1 Tax=Aspergillus costaricaensis CBS 115574 TaxID=1448317 RepID=A0ACD1IUD5_9EURO|nr:short-chain dehydrogenase [Aspergillus costaricaensis CBS 115574]RAK93956.1 short-chain dehydrogenase [Aspergillus costaricaensis CBS 115574]